MSPNSASKLASFKCSKCKKTFKNSQHVSCSQCKSIFNLSCTTLTVGKFKMMTIEEKSCWKCRKCLSNKQNKVACKTLVFTNTDRHEISLSKTSSVENLESSSKHEDLANSPVIDDSPKSLPNMSFLENSEISELKDQLQNATTELSSAHGEVMRLNSENSNLKKQVDEYQKRHNVYNKLLSGDTPKRRTPPRIHRATATNEIEKLKIDQLENEILKLKRNILILKQKIDIVFTENIQIIQQSQKKEDRTLLYIRRSILALQQMIKELAERPPTNTYQAFKSKWKGVRVGRRGPFGKGTRPEAKVVIAGRLPWIGPVKAAI
jgi:FtsZ-binding cell division protein ZapB